MAHTVGRPTDYTPELALKICEAIATSTDSYEKICKSNPDFPHRSNMRLWRYRSSDFRAMYAQAKADQAELLAEEIIEISDDGSADWIQDKDGNDKLDAEHVQRSRLRVDSRKWIACKLMPKVYGDKSEIKSTGTVNVVLHEDRLKELE